jgi:hypothetical protein
MGGCTSKNGTTEEVKYQRPNTHPRKSIIDNKQVDTKSEPVSNGKDVIEESNEIHLGGLKIRYAYVSQRGFYPDGTFLMFCDLYIRMKSLVVLHYNNSIRSILVLLSIPTSNEIIKMQ